MKMMVSSSSVWQQAVFSALWIVLSNVVVDVKAQGHLPLDVPGNLADHDTFGDLRFVSRMMVPYGPGDGYGFGMAALEEVAFDSVQKYLYAVSIQGYVNIIDIADPAKPVLTDLSLDLTGKEATLSSAQICPEQGVIFVSLKETATVDMYSTVQRSSPQRPQLLKSFEVAPHPRLVLPNRNCTVVAVGNSNPGKGLAQGSVTLIRNPILDSSLVDRVVIEGMDDAYLLKKGLHMPLSKAALEYWDEYSPMADELDFSEVRENYQSAIFLEPKALAWNGPEETELFVNMQENNGLMRIDVATAKVLSVASYGLKDHSRVPIDINSKDGTCALRTYESLFALLNPDAISTLRYNGHTYVVTANEGDYKEYGDFSEKWKAKSIFKGNEFLLPNVIIPPEIFDPQNFTLGNAALFNDDCEGPDCVSSTALTVGSSSIDYFSDPKNPIFYRMVMNGGRGWSIYEIPDDPDSLLKLVYDSADSLEETGCKHFPWSHNSGMDEDFAPADNLPNNTLWEAADEELREILTAMNDPEQDGCIDQGDGTPGACPLSQTVDARSGKDGSGIERLTVGVACDRLYAVMATEKSSIAYLFDITNVGSPDLKKVFHLSEASQNKSPGVAYNDGTLGEVDPENILFFPAEASPSGKASILFAGAYSGTFSYWEFDCKPSR